MCIIYLMRYDGTALASTFLLPQSPLFFPPLSPALPLFPFLRLSFLCLTSNVLHLHEWRQVERVATVLLLEQAHEETKGNEQDAVPYPDGNLLTARVLDARHLHAQADGAESQDGIYKGS